MVRRARQQIALDFMHFKGMSGEFYVPENLGPGIPSIDYDS